MENTYFLEVVSGAYAPFINRIPFPSMEAAVQQLGMLAPKLGHGRLGRSNDPNESRHTITGGDGLCVLVVEHIISARVIDQAEFNRLTEYADKSAE